MRQETPSTYEAREEENASTCVLLLLPYSPSIIVPLLFSEEAAEGMRLVRASRVELHVRVQPCPTPI